MTVTVTGRGSRARLECDRVKSFASVKTETLSSWSGSGWAPLIVWSEAEEEAISEAASV